MRRVLVGLAAVVSACLLPRPAGACSCAGIENPRAAIAAAAGAFVGVLERVEGDQYEGATFVYRVEHAVKGVTGTTVSIPSSGGGGGCGLEHRPGQRAGLFLGRKGGDWTASLCSSIDPERLLAAARPLPPPDGKGPPAFVVGNSLGDERSMLLDARGRTLAYGRGPGPQSGHVVDLALCPGGRRVVEALSAFGDGQSVILAVRSLDDFKLEREVAMKSLPGIKGRSPNVQSVRCRGPGADAIDVVVDDYRDSGSRTVVFRLENGAWRAVWQGDDAQARLAGSSAVTWRKDRIERVDLATGGVTTLSQTPATAVIEPSPDGRLIAVLTTTANEADYRAERLLVLDVATGAQRAALELGKEVGFLELAWADDRTLATAGQSPAVLTLLDDRLRTVATVSDWNGRGLMATGGAVYASRFGGGLVSASRSRPTAQPFVSLPDGATFAIAALPVAEGSPPPTGPPLTTTIAAPPTTLLWDPVFAPPFQPTATESDRPWAPAAAATLLLIAVAAVARRSVRRSG